MTEQKKTTAPKTKPAKSMAVVSISGFLDVLLPTDAALTVVRLLSTDAHECQPHFDSAAKRMKYVVQSSMCVQMTVLRPDQIEPTKT